MSLTVKEIKELPVAESFQLIAGASGLNQPIEHVNLLDFEYDAYVPDAKSSDGIFDSKSIVVTSLLYAKGKPDKILPVVKQLFLDGVSALAVKAVYYKDLPEDVLTFANEKGFPIFLFGSEANFAENVVVGLTLAIEDYNNVSILEEKLMFFLQDNLTSYNRISLMDELFPDLFAPFQCIYYMPKKIGSAFSFHRLILSYRKSKDQSMTILPYQYGLLVTLSSPTPHSLQDVHNILGLSPTGYYCGVSQIADKKDDLVHKIKESFYSSNFGQIHNKNVSYFKDIGIWKIILPNLNNYWMQAYCSDIINQLKGYDIDGSCELYNTISCYVINSFDINQTAALMHVHKNTVRYRVNKAKELLSAKDNLGELHQIILLAIYFHEAMI